MKPYYQDDAVTLYHGDCREITDWLETDVLVTDPPYGIGYASNRVAGRTGQLVTGDASTTVRDEAISRWDNNRPAVVFGHWRAARPIGTRQVLIWDKSEGNGTGSGLWSPWGMSHEEIYILGHWPAITPGGRAREGGTPARSSGVLRVPNYNTQAVDRPDHPTPKPIGLMARLLDKCPPGSVADPFAGSGSTLVAAKQIGRKAVGVELDESYCETIAKRLCQDVLDFGGAA